MANIDDHLTLTKISVLIFLAFRETLNHLTIPHGLRLCFWLSLAIEIKLRTPANTTEIP